MVNIEGLTHPNLAKINAEIKAKAKISTFSSVGLDDKGEIPQSSQFSHQFADYKKQRARLELDEYGCFSGEIVFRIFINKINSYLFEEKFQELN